MNDTYLTTPETSEYLKTARGTLSKMRVTGSGPPYTRIGRAIRYKKSDLDQWMTERLTNSTSTYRTNTQREV
jgi:excisionase family DNA binding protein